MTYNITYSENSDFGQDVLNVLGIIGALQDLKGARKVDALGVAFELRKEADRLVKRIFDGKKDYFEEVE